MRNKNTVKRYGYWLHGLYGSGVCTIDSDEAIDSAVLKGGWLLGCVSVVYYLIPILYIKRRRIEYIRYNTRKKRVMGPSYIEQ